MSRRSGWTSLSHVHLHIWGLLEQGALLQKGCLSFCVFNLCVHSLKTWVKCREGISTWLKMEAYLSLLGTTRDTFGMLHHIIDYNIVSEGSAKFELPHKIGILHLSHTCDKSCDWKKCCCSHHYFEQVLSLVPQSASSHLIAGKFTWYTVTVACCWCYQEQQQKQESYGGHVLLPTFITLPVSNFDIQVGYMFLKIFLLGYSYYLTENNYRC